MSNIKTKIIIFFCFLSCTCHFFFVPLQHIFKVDYEYEKINTNNRASFASNRSFCP